MPTPVIPIDRSLDIARRLVVGRLKHQDYDRTVRLAATYKRLITGEDMGPLYRRYNPRESEEAHKQALEITNPITPAICSALSNPLLKLANRSPKLDVIKYEGDNEEKRANQLRRLVDEFAGGKGLDEVFGESFLPYGLQDPNAFALFTFENFDNRYEKARVFSTIQPSVDVWNFEYFSDELQWLFLHKTIQYEVGGGMSGSPKTLVDGDRFILYTGEHHIVFTEIDKTQYQYLPKGILVDPDNTPLFDADGVLVINPVISDGQTAFPYYLNAGSNVYRVHVYAQRSKRVPAFRLGFKKDDYTSGRTCVNFWDAAIPFLLKNVKSVREMDLSFTLHTFLQRISYAPKCQNNGCNGGQMPEGGECGVCKGTGKQSLPGSAQEHIELAMPTNRDPNALIDLEKLVHYVALPTDILKIQMENVQSQITGAWKAVYNSDVFVSDTTANTATGVKVDMQSVYDAIQPASTSYSTNRTTSVYLLATFNDIDEKLVVIHRFPHDLHYETQDQLLERITKGKGVVTNGLMQHWQDELIDVALYDDPMGAARVKTMTRFDPFVGKSDDAVMTIISQGLTTKRNKTLWANLPYVFDEAEATVTDTGKTFYQMSYTDQKAIIDGIVMKLIGEQEEAIPEPLRLGTEPDQDEVDRDSMNTPTDDGQGTQDPVPQDRQ